MTLPEHAGLGGGAASAAGDLIVDTDLLREAGTTFVTKSTAIGTNINTIGTKVGTITDSWRDATGEDFSEKFQTFNSSYGTVPGDLNSLGNYMTTFADKYETAVSTALNAIEE